MTRDEKIDEWNYRFDERLGSLCEDRKPTEAQIQVAFQDADDWWYDAN